MQTFTVERINSSQVAATFPLVRQIIPEIDRAAWLKYARRATLSSAGNRVGVMIARDSNTAFPSGLFCYRTIRDPKHGMVLSADHFIAMHVLDSSPVVDAMIAELDHLAERLECAAVRSVVHGDVSDVAGRLMRAGHMVEGAQFCKVLGSALAVTGRAAGGLVVGEDLS